MSETICNGNVIVKCKCNIPTSEDNLYCSIHSKLIDKCSICLGDINFNHQIFLFNKNIGYELSCGHIFHYKCINKWFEKHDTCPYCRDLVNDDPIVLHRKKIEYDVNGKIILDSILANSSVSGQQIS